MPNRIVFLINTEFVLLVSLIYFLNYKKEANCWKPVFVILRSNPKRFRDLQLDHLPGVVHLYQDNLNTFARKPSRDFTDVLKCVDCAEIVIQNPWNPANQIIYNHFIEASPTCRIVLISDGAVIGKRFTLRELAPLYLRKLYRKYIQQFPISLAVPTYTTMMSQADGLIAHQNFGLKEFYDVNTLIKDSKRHAKVLHDVFKVDMQIYRRAQIIFFTQPITQQTTLPELVKQQYVDAVQLMSRLALEHHRLTVVKVHPAENSVLYNPYAHDWFVIAPDTNVPAEIILALIDGVKVVSMWSSISLYDREGRNQHFWLNNAIGHELPPSLNHNTHIKSINDLKNLEQALYN